MRAISFMADHIFASQKSNLYTIIYPLDDLASVNMMCFEISGHLIILHKKTVRESKVSIVILKHPTMNFCLNNIFLFNIILSTI